MSGHCRPAKMLFVIFGKIFVSNRIARFRTLLGIWEQSSNDVYRSFSLSRSKLKSKSKTIQWIKSRLNCDRIENK